MNRFALLIFPALLCSIPLSAAPPSFPARPNASDVSVRVPVGKSIVIPLPVDDPDGDPVQLKVTSSSPALIARVRAGLPILRMRLQYTAPTTGSAPVADFTADLDFQLFRDLTPITADTIASLAQSGFYDGTVFHRLANLDPSQPNGSFIFQGGDPQGTGGGGPVGNFRFENEFVSGLIFTGRGQLAMANAGYNRGISIGSGRVSVGDFRATNGSQFFITDQQPRFLDFKHTIFAQLLRGWDTLDKLKLIPRNGSDRPTSPLNLVSATVLATSDATLIVSAVDLVNGASLEVSAEDGTSAPTKKTIPVVTFEDTVNNDPIAIKIPNLLVRTNQTFSVPVRAEDLEHDQTVAAYLTTNSNSQAGIFNPTLNSGNTPLAASIPIGVAQGNDPQLFSSPTAQNPFAPWDPFNVQIAEIGVGEKPLFPVPSVITGTAGTPLTSAPLIEFRDGDVRGRLQDYVASVVWGDNTAPASSLNSNSGITIERSKTRAGYWTVRGTHTFAKPGMFAIRTSVTGNLGATGTVTTVAFIADGAAPLVAAGEQVEAVGPTVAARRLATFKLTSGTPTHPSQFRATIAWGDGSVTPGVIRAERTGGFGVYGSHTYRDSQSYNAQVQINGPVSGNSSTATVWTTIGATGFTAPRHLPPFDKVHLRGSWDNGNEAAFPAPMRVLAPNPVTGTNFVTGSFVVINDGNKASRAATLRFYLSDDATFNPNEALPNTQETDPTGGIDPGTGQVRILTVPHTQDRLLSTGALNGRVPPITPQRGLRFSATRTGTDSRIRLPIGETGAGRFLIAALEYSDPITDHMPVQRSWVIGPFTGIVASPLSVRTRETAVATDPQKNATVSFRLDTAPTSEVVLELESTDTSEGTLNTTSLTFTPQNFATPQTVTIQGVDDTIKDGSQVYFVRVKTSRSNDLRFNQVDPVSIRVTQEDND